MVFRADLNAKIEIWVNKYIPFWMLGAKDAPPSPKFQTAEGASIGCLRSVHILAAAFSQ
jgi:hypothetical protein